MADYIAASEQISKGIIEAFRGRSNVIPFSQREVRILAGAA
ncbi:MAG TPA: hypothetical protein VMH26_15930 [Burkholderiales bacterium]|nr:hypothetical protein [Burkholderiales bacterium]